MAFQELQGIIPAGGSEQRYGAFESFHISPSWPGGPGEDEDDTVLQETGAPWYCLCRYGGLLLLGIALLIWKGW